MFLFGPGEGQKLIKEGVISACNTALITALIYNPHRLPSAMA